MDEPFVPRDEKPPCNFQYSQWYGRDLCRSCGQLDQRFCPAQTPPKAPLTPPNEGGGE